MANLLLDTSFLMDVLNDRRGRADLMERMIIEQHTLACCAINVAEVYVGLRASQAQKTETLMTCGKRNLHLNSMVLSPVNLW
jgi:predicted nucleic acid-binding protein